MPALRRGKGEEQRSIHSEWDVAFFPGPVMIAEKSHFTTHCHVCKTASVKAHPEHSSEEAPVVQVQPVWVQDASTKEVQELTKWKPDRRRWGWGLQDKRWQRLLLWLLMAYWLKWQCIQLSLVQNRPHPHPSTWVKRDQITQPEKRLFFPLNPAGQGPITVPSTSFSIHFRKAIEDSQNIFFYFQIGCNGWNVAPVVSPTSKNKITYKHR